MTKYIFILIILTVSFPEGVAQTTAEKIPDSSGWKKLGVTTISFLKQNSEILILDSAIYSTIKFKVSNEPVNLQNIEVFYETGENQNVDMNFNVEPGKESREIQLLGGERKLIKVEFIYRHPSNKNDIKTNIELWGIRKSQILND